MRLKVLPDLIDKMLDNADCEVTARGERLISAVKPMNYGRIRISLRRPNRPYEAAYYWYCDVHFEHGLPPNRYFDSEEVNEFLDKYVKPFMYKSKRHIYAKIDN